MAKSKSQKQLEAAFRNARGLVVELSREYHDYKKHGSDFFDVKQHFVKMDSLETQIKESIALYRTFPLYLQAQGFEGWNVEGLDSIHELKILIEKEVMENSIATHNLIKANPIRF